MGSADNREQGSVDRALFYKPDWKMSRRNFVAGVSVLAGAIVGAVAVGKTARADPSDTGCDSSNITPFKCTNCFLSGTRIATPDKELEIDKLRIGDLVASGSGGPRPIKWIGRRRVVRAPCESWDPDVAPVRIARFALDGQTPHADLYLSPAHAIYLYGLLIPAKHLVNGRSITANHHGDALALNYYHIELDTHDVVLAEGALAETYGGNNRFAFDNAEEYEELYGRPVSVAQSFAQLLSLNGGRQELLSRLRSVISPVYDARKPLDVIRDQIASRADLEMAA
jgi:hypothetical protein